MVPTQKFSYIVQERKEKSSSFLRKCEVALCRTFVAAVGAAACIETRIKESQITSKARPYF